MFDTLTDKFSGVFRSLSGRGRISEENIRESMRDVRTALLEADVNLKVVDDFIDHVIQKPIGQEVIKSLQPGELMVKICYDELLNLLGPVDTRDLFCPAGPHGHHDVRAAGLGQNHHLRKTRQISRRQGPSSHAGGGGFAASGGGRAASRRRPADRSAGLHR